MVSLLFEDLEKFPMPKAKHELLIERLSDHITAFTTPNAQKFFLNEIELSIVLIF